MCFAGLLKDFFLYVLSDNVAVFWCVGVCASCRMQRGMARSSTEAGHGTGGSSISGTHHQLVCFCVATAAAIPAPASDPSIKHDEGYKLLLAVCRGRDQRSAAAGSKYFVETLDGVIQSFYGAHWNWLKTRVSISRMASCKLNRNRIIRHEFNLSIH